MTESLMTDTAATTTEGTPASQDPASNPPTGEAQAGGNQQQASEGQTQQAQDGATADQSGENAPSGAPEKYEFAAPEGKEFDPEVIGVYSEIAKELNLPQEAAQKMLDKMAPFMEQHAIQQIEALQTQWKNDAVVDKEFGGEKLRENLSVAKKALDQFATPQLRELLDKSGLGNHPEIIRFMFRAGKAISEDTFVGNSPGSGKADPKGFNDFASALYSNQPTQ
jgi:hypothetical protein